MAKNKQTKTKARNFLQSYLYDITPEKAEALEEIMGYVDAKSKEHQLNNGDTQLMALALVRSSLSDVEEKLVAKGYDEQKRYEVLMEIIRDFVQFTFKEYDPYIDII